MATQTRVLRRFNDPLDPSIEGRLEIDWDDVSLRITRLRCVNPTSQPFWFRAAPDVDPTVAIERTYAANSGTSVDNVPGNAASRYAVTMTASGKLSGVTYQTAYPAP